MERRWTTGIVLGMGLALTACNPLRHFRPTALNVPPPQTLAASDDDDHAAWAETEPYAIMVRKSCQTLDVYRYGQRIRSFPAVFGLNGNGTKLFEGDLRTPIGLYMIVDKRSHARWRNFLLLDYPNAKDIHRYWLAVGAGDIPRRGAGYAGMGGAVGIHGTDKPSLNQRNVDWTLGCVSLHNADVADLAALVPVGTLVLIQD